MTCSKIWTIHSHLWHVAKSEPFLQTARLSYKFIIDSSCKSSFSIIFEKSISVFNWFISTSICISFDCKILVGELTTTNTSYQIVKLNKNSKSPNSYFAKELASLLVLIIKCSNWWAQMRSNKNLSTQYCCENVVSVALLYCKLQEM